jgi:serine protease Do
MVRRIALLLAYLATLGSLVAQDESVVSQMPATGVAVSTESQGDPGERIDEILAGNAIPKTIDDLQAMQEHFSRLAERVKRATVGVDCGGAQGSGVIISRDGLVLTAAHVIGEPGLDAAVRLSDGKIVKAKTKGLIHFLDSGLMKITDPGDYEYLDMGDSSALQLGQWVMAIGHPGGYEEKRGMVVRVGRILYLSSRVIRSDCALVGGDSGGPLVDMDGNVIGIHSRIGARLTDNLHVPISVYSSGWDDLESDKDVGGSPPTIGVTLKGENGLEIESLQPDGPAERAGIKPGDTILEINGKSIVTREQLAEELDKLQVGVETKLKVLRGTEELTMTLVVGRRR